MKNSIYTRLSWRRVLASCVVSGAVVILLAQTAAAASWSGIEPLKSRRADVERALGKPLLDQPGEDGILHFKVAGGMVTVTFVTARFVQTKKLFPALEGTVLQIVLQHDNSSDTPESLGLRSKSGFEREEGTNGFVYRNLRDGIAYTFIEGKLRTTRYSATTDQLARARKG